MRREGPPRSELPLPMTGIQMGRRSYNKLSATPETTARNCGDIHERVPAEVQGVLFQPGGLDGQRAQGATRKRIPNPVTNKSIS